MGTAAATHAKMGAIDVLLAQAKAVHGAVNRNADGIAHDESLAAPGLGGNCFNWILGHLVWANTLVLRVVNEQGPLSDEELKPYARGSEELHDAARAIPLEKLLAAWNETCTRIEAGLPKFTPEFLESQAPFSPRNKDDETVGSLLTALMFHQAYHAGQLGLCRRAIGKVGVIK